MDRKRKILSLLATLIITLACVPALPAVAPLPTQPAGAVETMVAGTSAAAGKATARASSPTPQPSNTPRPSPTFENTPSPTATVIFKLPTFVISVGGEGGSGGSSGGGSSGGGGGSSEPPPKYACKVLKTNPISGSHIPPDKDFNVLWHVANKGTDGWDENSVDYLFAHGAPIYVQEVYDLPYSVPPGNRISLVAKMHSPKKPGTYKTVWAMHVSEVYFCHMEMRIIVP